MAKESSSAEKQKNKKSTKKPAGPKGKQAPQRKSAPVAPPPPEPKVLRIGVIQGGKIIEERIIRKRDTVSIGHSEKNTFVIPSPQLPPRFDLFEMRGGQYHLNFLEKMDGRVSMEDGVTDLGDLRKKPNVKQKDKYQILLNEQSRGKIVMGDSTLLFQFVVPPPIQPRPQLPAAARGGLVKNIDWVFASICLVSFIIHFGIIIWWENKDWPVVEGWQGIPDRFAKLLVPPDVGLKDKPTELSDEGEAVDGEGEEEKPTKSSSKSEGPKGPQLSAEERARQRAEQRAQLTEALAKTGINKILGAMTADGEGGIADILQGGDVGSDQDSLFQQVSGVNVAKGDGTGSLSGPVGGDSDGVVADISNIKSGKGGKGVKTDGVGGERKLKAKTRRSKSTAVDGTGILDGAAVSKVLKQRMASIQACYERALRRDPTLGGKVKIQFTIAGSGRVSSARVVSNDVSDAVGNCVASAIKRLRFPPPEGGSVTFQNSFLFESSR